MSYFLYLGVLTVAPTTNFARKRVKTRYLTLFRATKNCVVICEQVCTSQFAIFWRNQAMSGLQTVSKMQQIKTFQNYRTNISTHPLQIYSWFWHTFCMLKLSKFPPQYGGGVTFYYISHVMNRFISHVYCARPLNGFENSLNLAENRIEHVLLTTWDGNSIFVSENRARPGLQKLPFTEWNGFTEWNYNKNKEKTYQNRE